MLIRLVFALTLAGSVLAYVISPTSVAAFRLTLPEWSRGVGLAIGVLCPLAVHWVLGALGSNVSETVLTRQGQRLVTGGPYRYVRHPLYTTGVAMFFAIGLMASSGLILGLSVLVVLGVRLVIVPSEERELLARFGAEYQDLVQRTGALLPRVFGGVREHSHVARRLALVSLVVPDYDEAIAYYTEVLGFHLDEDTDLGGGKRWVVVRPSHGSGAGLLLARASGDSQTAAIGNQTGGRVFLFIHTNSFVRDYEAYRGRGVTFLGDPRHEEYGTVVVFEDRYGNRWDLIQPRS
ncbi:MAG: protein-S-isoprenylcysteine O-methyltransferase Ste14 [Rhodothermales bacterium]|jgi:protein-S-isoprenylcysteine O-methyltransferase Ste14/catechol 2,3-dioxygenase-like lactoylglutathione lyase family enzyme